MSVFRTNNITNRDTTAGPVISGITTVSSTGYMRLPVGPTEYRGGRGRGVFGGGAPATNTIDYVTISTTSNAFDFGDLVGLRNQLAGCSSSTRGVFAGGENPTSVNTIEYITISSTGSAFDFGDLTKARRRMQSCGFSNSIRGFFAGGYNPSLSPATINTIDIITIATLGNSSLFGDLTKITESSACCSSPTRGIIGGGRSQPANLPFNIIEFVTISSLGNGVDFGDLSISRFGLSSLSNSVRGVFSGGNNPSAPTARQNVIDFITIASTGDAQDFGDLTTPTEYITSTSNPTRGIFGGGNVPTNTNTIEFITILSSGNAQDFGDLTVQRQEHSAISDAHGGLG